MLEREVHTGEGEEDRQDRGLEVVEDAVYEVGPAAGDVRVDGAEHEARQHGRDTDRRGEAAREHEGDDGARREALRAEGEPGRASEPERGDGAQGDRRDELGQEAARIEQCLAAEREIGPDQRTADLEDHDAGRVVEGDARDQRLHEHALRAGLADERDDRRRGGRDRDGAEEERQIEGRAPDRITSAEHQQRRDRRLRQQQIEEPAYRVREAAHVEVGADRDRDQPERDLGHRLEPGDRLFREEVEARAADHDAPDDLSRDPRQSCATREGARETAREQDDGQEQERARVVQGVESGGHAGAEDTPGDVGARGGARRVRPRRRPGCSGLRSRLRRFRSSYPGS